MWNFKNISGQVFNRLTVVERDGSNKHGKALWVCLCECGKSIVAVGCDLRSGRTQSCGCLQSDVVTCVNTSHDERYSNEYGIWSDMHKRCKNKKAMNYHDYGGRGIHVCERWNSFSNFLADMGKRPSQNHSIERINNDNGYSPDNCCWANRIQQSRNSRLRKDNKTGIRGVTQKEGRFYAYISVNRKRIHLGGFKTLEAAAESRATAEKQYWKNFKQPRRL